MARRGFTFIEMMTVIVLIGIIAAFGFRGCADLWKNKRAQLQGGHCHPGRRGAQRRGAARLRGHAHMSADSVWVTAVGEPPGGIGEGRQQAVRGVDLRRHLESQRGHSRVRPARPLDGVSDHDGARDRADVPGLGVINQLGKVVRQ